MQIFLTKISISEAINYDRQKVDKDMHNGSSCSLFFAADQSGRRGR